MIPKVIHYCWFSGEKLPKLMQRCLDSWCRTMPDYTIKCWDAQSFDFDSVAFTREAMSRKKYAFVADYIRLYALYTEGGIYLDSDVEVYRNFSPFLESAFFCGTEAFLIDAQPHYRMEAAIMAAEPQHPFIRHCLDAYDAQHFLLADGNSNQTVMPAVISHIAHDRFGYRYENQLQQLPHGMTIHPTSVFANELVPPTVTQHALYAKHCNAGSWIDYKERGRFFHFCRKHDLMALYHLAERLSASHRARRS